MVILMIWVIAILEKYSIFFSLSIMIIGNCAGANAGKALEGEMFKMTLSKPKNGNAQHLRAVSILPLRTGFQPAIETLKELYGVRASS